MQNRKPFIMIMCAIAVALNIVLGTVVQKLQIPLLFLDAVGTIFAAVLFGPWYGAAVGTITNVLTGIITGNPKDIPFFLVNAVAGIIVGYMARKFKFTIVTSVITGLILSIVCPLIGTPISIWLYGGLTGGGNDFLFLVLKNSGMQIFSAAFIPRITGNIIDKIGSCLLVFAAMKYIPAQYRQNKNIAA